MIFSCTLKRSEIVTFSQIFQHYESLELDDLDDVESDSIISLTVSYCKELKYLKLHSFENNIGIIDMFSQHCKGLQSLHLSYQYTSQSYLISISNNCTDLKTLHLANCNEEANAGIISIAHNCIHLKD